jgi:hypothetical protein
MSKRSSKLGREHWVTSLGLLFHSGRFTPKADEPYQLPCSTPEPHARIRLHSKLLLNIYNAQQQASRLRRPILNDSITLLRKPRSQSNPISEIVIGYPTVI